MVVRPNLSEGQQAWNIQLIGQSETTTLKTILYIESPLKSVYNIGHSNRLFNVNESALMHHRGRVENVTQQQEKLKSGEHQKQTTVLCISNTQVLWLICCWILAAASSQQSLDLRLCSEVRSSHLTVLLKSTWNHLVFSRWFRVHWESLSEYDLNTN